MALATKADFETRRPALALTLRLVAGCATTAALRDGTRAEQAQDYDRAVVEYTKALQENPDDRDARQGLERAKLRASQDHFTRGRRLHATGRLDEALVELQLAAELNPANPQVDDLLERRAHAAADQDRRGPRGQDGARDADRASARPAAARPRSARAT